MSEAEIQSTLYMELDKLGFQTPLVEESLFAQKEAKVKFPRYIIGIQMDGYEVDLAQYRSTGVNKRTTMELTWKVLDRKTDEVVLDYSNRVTYKSRDYIHKILPDKNLAFKDALYEFLENSEFIKLVNGSDGAFDYDSADSTGSPQRSLSQVEIPKFDKYSDMIKHVGSACVTIVTDGSIGSGVVVDKNGYVLSAYHVVDGVNRVQVGFNTGLTLDTEIVAANRTYDVVLLDINGSGFNAVPVYAGDQVPLGEEVITIGTPLSMELGQSVAKGMVSGNRQVEDRKYIQADISVSPGNSGGPLFNQNGVVIGIVQSKIVFRGVEGIGFTLPIKQALDVLNLKVKEN